jgi:trimeric autotransporter adhesin
VSRILLGFGALAVVVAASLLPVDAEAGTSPQTFTVRFLDDTGDENLNDDLCDVTDDISGAQCTYRAAIQEANHTPGLDFIRFDIGGTPGVKTIVPQSDLPPITDPVSINGYSQPGARVNRVAKGTNAVLKVQLDGRNLAGGVGVYLQASNSTVRGLVINRFTTGIAIAGDQNRVEGNFIGPNPSGRRGPGNSGEGVAIGSGIGNFVGGDSLADRNLISGNGFYGVSLLGGIHLVTGNLIGTDRSGKEPLGNNYAGVVAYTTNHLIGGSTRRAGNVIAFNRTQGVLIYNISSQNVQISRNSIFSNGEIGIDLGDDGRTPNDVGDMDSGANGLLNFPLITSAKTGRRGTTIRGRLESYPGDPYGIEFFSSPPGRPAEGKKYLGQVQVATDATTGVARFTFRPGKDVPLRHRITATAIDDGGNTSEFSNPRRVRRA